MIVALTGSTGFLGARLVPQLLAKGHQVVALVRPGRNESTPPWLLANGVRVVPTHLDDQAALVTALSGSHAVIHALAALSGDEATQRNVSVSGTEAVLRAMADAGIQRLVGISSLSVYGWGNLEEGDVLNEASPLESNPSQRDAYARCKSEQDALFNAFGSVPGQTAVVLRPGIFYGVREGHADTSGGLWNFAVGKALTSDTWLLMGPLGRDAEVPMVHVDDVASAVIAALTLLDQPGNCGSQVFNLVEEPAPVRAELVAALNEVGPRRKVVTLPWQLHLWVARLVSALMRPLAGTASRLPGLLQPSALWARHAPLHYDSTRARQLLGWKPCHQAIRDMRARSLPLSDSKT